MIYGGCSSNAKKKTKKDKFPKDSVFVLNLASKALTGYADVMSSALPIEESGWLAILLKPKEEKPDTSEEKKDKKKDKKPKDSKDSKKDKKTPYKREKKIT